jgi:ribose transport system substrate-binding protein
MFKLIRKLLGAAIGITSLLASPLIAQQKPRTIGFTVYSMTSWVTWGKQGVDTVAKANNVTVLWNSAEQDVTKQISHFQQYIDKHVDAIIVDPVNSATLGPQIEAATKAGIPVIGANIRIDPPTNQLLKAYIGPDDVGAGEQEAQAVVDAIHASCNVLVLQGPIGTSAEQDRTQGIKNVLGKSPDVKLLAIQPANWDRTQAYNLMQDWLSRYGSQINGVIAENDDMAIGAIRALHEKGLAGKMPVSGIDGIKDGMREVKSGNLLETNLQNGALELGMALQVTLDFLDKKEVQKVALLKMPRVTKENVEHYYDQIYVNPDKFLSGLSNLVLENLKSGDYAHE